MRPLTLDPAPLLRLVPGSAREQAERLRVTARTIVRWRSGATRVQRDRADALAVAAGYHPFEVWPELADHAIEAVTLTCERCSMRFVPPARTPKGRARFCSKNCRVAAWRTTPKGRAVHLAARRRYYERHGDAERERNRRYKHETRAARRAVR